MALKADLLRASESTIEQGLGDLTIEMQGMKDAIFRLARKVENLRSKRGSIFGGDPEEDDMHKDGKGFFS
jgi:hypothetical protein